MTGFYLYCIRNKNGPKISGWGINGDERVYVVPYREIEAVVSEVDLEEFSSEEIQRKAQEDLNWIKEKAQIHEKVIEKAMGLNADLRGLYADRRGKNPRGITAVIPMKFGTIFKTRKKLEGAIKKHYFTFKKGLENLTGKQEWSVKVYLNRKILEEEVKKNSSAVREKEKEVASMPEGMAYFMQKQVDEVVSKETDKIFRDYGEKIFKTLRRRAESGLRGKILEKEFTGKSLPMFLSAIFLVSEEKLEDFVKEINKLNKEYKNKGFVFEYSGPWPPYNFI